MKPILGALLIMSLLVSPGVAGPTASTQVGAAQVELRLNKAVYDVGESVEISLSVTNPGSSNASFRFPTGQMHDFIVLRDGQLIWQWSHGKGFTQAFTTLTLRPGESKAFSDRWDQRNNDGQQVLPGEYEMAAVFPVGSSEAVVPTRVGGLRVPFAIVARSGPSSPHTVPPIANRAVTIGGTVVGEVLINVQPVLRIRVAAGGLSASKRAEIVAARLLRFLTEGLKADELAVVSLGSEAAITWRGQLVVTVDAKHARLNNTTPHMLASEWLKLLIQALAGGR